MNLASIRWRTSAGEAVSCLDKLKVLTENLEELRAVAQDALEDAIVIGCDEAQVRQVLRSLVDDLDNPYRGAGR